MCEFCLNPERSGDRDALHLDFQGFFSADAIQKAIEQAKESRADEESTAESDGGNQDDDGT